MVIFLLQAKGVEFCVRLKDDWNIVKAFKASDKQDQILSFDLPKKDFDKLAQYPEYQHIQIQCRLVKVVLKTGETEILCTSLIDEKYINLMTSKNFIISVGTKRKPINYSNVE